MHSSSARTIHRVFWLALIVALTTVGCAAEGMEGEGDKAFASACAVEIVDIETVTGPYWVASNWHSEKGSTGLWKLMVQVDVRADLIKNGYTPAVNLKQATAENGLGLSFFDRDGIELDVRDFTDVEGAGAGMQRFELAVDFRLTHEDAPVVVTPYLVNRDVASAHGAEQVLDFVDGRYVKLGEQSGACDGLGDNTIEQTFSYDGEDVFIRDADRELQDPGGASPLCATGDMPSNAAWVGEATASVTVHERFAKSGPGRAEVTLNHHWHGDLRVDIIDPGGNEFPLHRCQSTPARRGGLTLDLPIPAEELVAGEWTVRVRDYFFDSSGVDCGKPGIADADRNCKNELQSFEISVAQSVD